MTVQERGGYVCGRKAVLPRHRSSQKKQSPISPDNGLVSINLQIVATAEDVRNIRSPTHGKDEPVIKNGKVQRVVGLRIDKSVRTGNWIGVSHLALDKYG